MRPPPFRRDIFKKRMLRNLILRSLQEQPTHRYDLIKRIGFEFGGLYNPSAGAVYSAVQILEDEGYVVGEKKEGKKVYSVTPEGIEFLKKREDVVNKMMEKRQTFLREKQSLNRELRNLVSLIMTNYRELESEKADAISQVLKEARRKVSDVIFE
jgi:DNA-binding PadR family transcriptional regulator